LCLLTKASVAIDGSKFKAVNSRDNNFTQGKIQRRQKQIEESVARYMSQLDTADRQTAAGEEPSETVLLTKTRLKEKLAKLEEEVKRLAAIEKALLASPDKQISLTDPDCRSMATSGRGSGMVAYNVQSAVDTTNHLIVAHEVTNVGTDRSQLATMAQAAKAALRSGKLDVIADRGYFKGEEILACGRHAVTGTAAASISPEGIAFSPNSRFIVTAALTRSFMPWSDERLTAGGALDLISLDDRTGRLNHVANYPLQGILTGGLAFDASGNFVAVTHFDRYEPRRRRGVVEFWRLIDGGTPRLERTNYELDVVPGPHTLHLVL
jgi:hypothetical protein